MIADPVVRHLEEQVEAFTRMGSALYARVTTLALDDYRARGVTYDFFSNVTARASLSTPGVRLMGALHYLALSGEVPELQAHLPSCGGDGDPEAIWETAQELLVTREARIGELFAETPQTNEVGRSTVLLAGLCSVVSEFGLPLRLFDIGASAGLNTRLDYYRYEGEGWSWGDARSPLVLRNRIASGAPLLTDALAVVERAACDLHPLDPSLPEHRMRLLSFVWADMPERLARLRAALEVAAAHPLVVDAADMYAWISQRVAPSHGRATVIMHSVIADHLSTDERARLAELIAHVGQAARDGAPVGWVRMEFSRETARFETRVTVWPGGRELLIARSDGHAQGIEWIA